MATIKSYTSLEQSKKLAEILPLESADMYYTHGSTTPDIMIGSKQDYRCYTMCWSLAALLDVIPRNLKIVLAVNDYWDGNAVKYKYAIGSVEHNNYDCYADNHVDACYELIIKLHEQNLL